MKEQIFEFLESFWGYALIGGVSMGTLISLVILVVKTYVNSKLSKDFKDTYEKMIKLHDDIVSLFGDKVKDNELVISYKEAEREAKEKYFEKVQAVTFKALSYIIMASKLSNEDKLRIQMDIAEVGKENISDSIKKIIDKSKEQIIAKTKEVVEDNEVTKKELQNATNEIVNSVVEDSKEEASNLVQETIKDTLSLLDKYK